MDLVGYTGPVPGAPLLHNKKWKTRPRKKARNASFIYYTFFLRHLMTKIKSPPPRNVSNGALEYLKQNPEILKILNDEHI